MKLSHFYRKLNRFLYFRKIEKSERKKLTTSFQNKAKSTRDAKALYRDLKHRAKVQYPIDLYKRIPFVLSALCIPLMLPVVLDSALLHAYHNLPSEALSPTLLELASLYIAREALSAKVLYALNIIGYQLNFFSALFALLALPLSVLRRNIKLLDYGRNLLLHLVQIPLFALVVYFSLYVTAYGLGDF